MAKQLRPSFKPKIIKGFWKEPSKVMLIRDFNPIRNILNVSGIAFEQRSRSGSLWEMECPIGIWRPGSMSFAGSALSETSGALSLPSRKPFLTTSPSVDLLKRIVYDRDIEAAEFVNR